jgi:two-component system, NtrC family, response regulator PilR
MPSILVADDELSMREFLKILLEKEGHDVTTVADGKAALKILSGRSFQLVISDIKMPRLSGLELLERVKEIDQHLPVVLITAYASPEDAVAAMKNGAFDYITKPFRVEEIKKIIGTALTRQPPAEESRQEETAWAGIIGNSPEMRKIFELIRQIAPTHANVAIYGESGTGKELVAKAIHDHSRAAGNAFVPITCSAIPENLFESEVFGHVKGAFTGAFFNKTGLFELANNGSAFLDEIGELSPLIQTKLLRVLQERELKPVGGTNTIKINVRIISATNRKLEEEVIAGRFREDLYYRLAVVPIRIPPLRERKGDVPLLVDHFLRKYSRQFGKDVRQLSSYAMEVLLGYDFPGNVRELENIIERGVALATSNIILPESLSLSVHRKKKEAGLTAGTDDNEDAFVIGLDEFISRQEKEIIASALEKAGNSKMKAAGLLKVSFRSLRYKIQKYGIQGEQ